MQTEHCAKEAFYKPVVNIRDAAVLTSWGLKNYLTGVVENYPEDHQAYPGAVTNGKSICSSEIVKIRGWYVETQRTIYFVLNWLEVPESIS